MNKVYGHGYNGSTTKYGLKIYRLWYDMLRRVYDNKFHEKTPAYIGTKCDPSWFNYESFVRDIKNIEGWSYYNDKDLKIQLDKDLKGKKCYSKNTCVFIPSRINSFLRSDQANNTSGFTGVSFDDTVKNKKWKVRVKDFNTKKNKHIGRYKTKEEASKEYLIAREEQAIIARSYMKNLGYSNNILEMIK